MSYSDLIFDLAVSFIPALTLMLITGLLFDYIRTMLFSSK